MQNKANFRNAKMNENLFATKDYENETAFRLQKYKPKQSQFQTGHLFVNLMKPSRFLTEVDQDLTEQMELEEGLPHLIGGKGS